MLGEGLSPFQRWYMDWVQAAALAEMHRTHAEWVEVVPLQQ